MIFHFLRLLQGCPQDSGHSIRKLAKTCPDPRQNIPEKRQEVTPSVQERRVKIVFCMVYRRIFEFLFGMSDVWKQILTETISDSQSALKTTLRRYFSKKPGKLHFSSKNTRVRPQQVVPSLCLLNSTLFNQLSHRYQSILLCDYFRILSF